MQQPAIIVVPWTLIQPLHLYYHPMFEKDVAEDIRDSFNNEAQILSHEVLL